MYKATIEILLDVENEAEADEAVGEPLRELLKGYGGNSAWLDWQYVIRPLPSAGEEFVEYMDDKARHA